MRDATTILVCLDRITFLSPWPRHYLYLEEVIGIDRTKQLRRQWKMSPHKKWIRAVWNLVSMFRLVHLWSGCKIIWRWILEDHTQGEKKKKTWNSHEKDFFFRSLRFWRSRYRRRRGCVVFRLNACVFWTAPFIRMTDCRHEFLK